MPSVPRRARLLFAALACAPVVAGAAPAVAAESPSSADELAVSSVAPTRHRGLRVADRPLVGPLGMTPPFAAPQPDPAQLQASIAAALARQAAARRGALAARPDPVPVVTPIRGAGYTTGFGARSKLWAVAHSGLDFSASNGTEAVAVVSGTIRSVFIHPSFGNALQLVRDDGVEMWYCHLSEVLVDAGTRVRQGQVVALTGDTGNTVGPHLHFEVRVGGVPTDPADFLFHTPGIASDPPSWAYAYSQEPAAGFTVIGYPPPKKPEKPADDEQGTRKPSRPGSSADTARPSPSPSASPSATPKPTSSPEPSASPTATPRPSASPGSGGGTATGGSTPRPTPAG